MSDLIDDIQEILSKIDGLESDHKEIMIMLSKGEKIQKVVTRSYSREIDEIKHFMEDVEEKQNFPWFNLVHVRDALAKKFYIQQKKKLTRILKRLHKDGFLESNTRNQIRIIPPEERDQSAT